MSILTALMQPANASIGALPSFFWLQLRPAHLQSRPPGTAGASATDEAGRGIDGDGRARVAVRPRRCVHGSGIAAIAAAPAHYTTRRHTRLAIVVLM